MSSLETKRYETHFGLDDLVIKKELESMLNQGMFLLHYFYIPEGLNSVCIVANGPPKNICSLARAFLLHAPSTQARIMDGGKSCVIISRIPANDFFEFTSKILERSHETDVSLQAHPISAYAGYRNNLYSRLLKEDGTWDDDVSGLLNQIRLRPKDGAA
ncbi:MAG: hypothetical protein ACFFFK_10545 [Candidatus Thorarchaeota archaeon]